jgi:hypothetical protein
VDTFQCPQQLCEEDRPVKRIRKSHVLRIAIPLVLFHINMKAIEDNKDARSLARLEQQCIAAFEQHDLSVLENVLADDFIYTGQTMTLGKREFIAQVGKVELNERTLQLADGRVRVYASAAISTGGATLRPRTEDQIKGNNQVTSSPAVVNLGQLARQEKPAPSPGAQRVVPAPMIVPHDLPVPVAGAQYRYTAVYVKSHGRWQMAALHLSQASRE